MPHHSNASELRSFLGTVNFLKKNIKNLSLTLLPLCRLLQREIEWDWSDECKQAFNNVKELLIKANFLAYYDPDKSLITCDASARRVSSVLNKTYKNRIITITFKCKKHYLIVEPLHPGVSSSTLLFVMVF